MYPKSALSGPAPLTHYIADLPRSPERFLSTFPCFATILLSLIAMCDLLDGMEYVNRASLNSGLLLLHLIKRIDYKNIIIRSVMIFYSKIVSSM